MKGVEWWRDDPSYRTKGQGWYRDGKSEANWDGRQRERVWCSGVGQTRCCHSRQMQSKVIDRDMSRISLAMFYTHSEEICSFVKKKKKKNRKKKSECFGEVGRKDDRKHCHKFRRGLLIKSFYWRVWQFFISKQRKKEKQRKARPSRCGGGKRKREPSLQSIC